MTLKEAMAELLEDEVMKKVAADLDAGSSPLSIIDELSEGMSIVGERFERQEYYLSELILAADILSKVVNKLEPLLSNVEQVSAREKVIMGTAQGDIHDIGKKIVMAVLKGCQYEVYDLGEDVPPEKFVEKIKETGARIVGISALITNAFDGMKETIAQIRSAGFSDDIKIMIGGGPVDEQVRDYVKADACGYNAMDAVRFVREWSSK